MTYLVENEQAALMVPARFLGRIHPHFREWLSSWPRKSPTRRGISRSSPAEPVYPAGSSAFPAPEAGPRYRRCSMSLNGPWRHSYSLSSAKGLFSLAVVSGPLRPPTLSLLRSPISPFRTRAATWRSCSDTAASTWERSRLPGPPPFCHRALTRRVDFDRWVGARGLTTWSVGASRRGVDARGDRCRLDPGARAGIGYGRGTTAPAPSPWFLRS